MKKLGLAAIVLALGACGWQAVPNCRGGACGGYVKPACGSCEQPAPAPMPCQAQATPCGGYVAPAPMPMPCGGYAAPAPMPAHYPQPQMMPQPMEYVEPYQPQQIPEQTMNRRNIVIKDKTPYSVTYEFYQVRLDELARYADEYCDYMGLKSILRESVTSRNNSRIATFDCVNPRDLK